MRRYSHLAVAGEEDNTDVALRSEQNYINALISLMHKHTIEKGEITSEVFMDNFTIAQQLLQTAHGLERKQVNLYRVRAYRRAAQVIRDLDRPVKDLLAEAGRKALKELPGIGVGLSTKIETLVRTGEFPTLKEEDKMLSSV